MKRIIALVSLMAAVVMFCGFSPYDKDTMFQNYDFNTSIYNKTVTSDMNEFISAWKSGYIYRQGGCAGCFAKNADMTGTKLVVPRIQLSEYSQADVHVMVWTDVVYYSFYTENSGSIKVKIFNLDMEDVVSSVEDTYNSLPNTDGVAYHYEWNNIYMYYEGYPIEIDFPEGFQMREGALSEYFTFELVHGGE